MAAMAAVVASLTSLNLSWNDLTNEGRDMTGIAAIAEALKVTASLTECNLRNNRLKDEGVSAVCDAVQSNKQTKLASLNLASNDCGSAGAKSVAAMVAVTGSLTKIE